MPDRKRKIAILRESESAQSGPNNERKEKKEKKNENFSSGRRGKVESDQGFIQVPPFCDGYQGRKKKKGKFDHLLRKGGRREGTHALTHQDR